jgi:hypothetical protein
MSRIAACADVLAGDYWDLLAPNERKQFKQWLDTVHTDSLRSTFGSPRKEKLRVTEVAPGAIETLKKKTPPEG